MREPSARPRQSLHSKGSGDTSVPASGGAPDRAAPPAGAINVLDLGVRNDGTEDVSEIVNRHTADHALFFPAGVYRVAAPIFAKNPLFGEGYARAPQADGTHTWFLSEIENDGTDIASETGVVVLGGSGRFTVSNLNIVCHSRECAILVNPCVQDGPVFVERVGLFDVRGYGILACKADDVPGFASRPLFLDNLTIFGAEDHPFPSVGIHIGGRIGDNRLSNVEIMGTRIGIHQEASFVYADNLHVWTGCLSDRDDGVWWETTRGLVLGKGDANFMGSNVYIDTAFALVELTSNRNTLSIQNFMSWDDGTARGCRRADARVFLVPDDLPEPPNVFLSGGLVYVAGDDAHPGRTASLTAPGPNARVENVRILSAYSFRRENFRRLTFLEKDTPRYRMRCEAAPEAREVLVAAVVAEAQDGCCAFACATDGGAFARIRVERDAGATDVVFEERRRDDLFRAEVSDGFVKVFAAVAPGRALDCSVDTAYATRLCFPIDLGVLKSFPDCAPRREIRGKNIAATGPKA